MFAACTLTLAPPQSGPPCGSAPGPLRVVALPIGERQAGDVPSEFGARWVSRAASLIDRWEPYIAEAAQRFAIPQEWIRAVMRSESGGRTTLNGQPITSVAGAMGLMQLMPGTYSDMRSRYGLGIDAYDPHDNVLAGAAYLRLMYRQYGYPSLFAAYHAGPARFDGYLLRGKALPDATLAYVGSIVPGVETTIAIPSRANVRAAPVRVSTFPAICVPPSAIRGSLPHTNHGCARRSRTGHRSAGACVRVLRGSNESDAAHP